MPGSSRQIGAARKYGASSLAYSTLDPRLEMTQVAGIDGYLAYKRAGKTLFGIYGPVCHPDNAPRLVDEFRRRAKDEGCRSAFFGATGEMAAALEGMGFTKHRAARDSWIDISEFSTRGNRMMNVRRGYNRARNVGLRWSEYTPGEKRKKTVEKECDIISRQWIKEKGGLELQFILGQADWSNPGDRRFFIARSERRIEGFLVYHPVYNEDSWYLDMSRRRTDSPNGTMDFLMVGTLGMFREEGARKLYMGMIPDLTFPDGLEKTNVVTRRVVKALVHRAEFFYPVTSETFFKQKYQPTWEDLYLCIEGKVNLGLLNDLLKAFQPKGVLGILGSKMWG